VKTLVTIVTGAAGIWVVLCALLYFGQRSLLYLPKPEVAETIADAIWVETSGARLKLWKLAGSGADAIVYFGGNAEPIEHNLDEFRDWFPEQSVYLVNYRGFGGSSGEPTETGLCTDAHEVFDRLALMHQRISVIGRSLGSGVATCLASARNVEKLALITPFDSVLAVATRMYRLFPVELLLKDRFDSVARAAHISADVLILLATEDGIVPPEHGRNLAEAFDKAQVKVHEIKGADHIDISESPEYGARLREFL
jgi:pimeloyl-ACP methyl ester carboxylesterase